MHPKIESFESALSAFCSKHGIKFQRWTAMPTSHVFEVLSPKKTAIYPLQNTDQNKPAWWGITKNVYAKLRSSTLDWNLVLLIGEVGQTGYLLTADEVTSMRFSTNSTQYIVHGCHADKGTKFTTFDDLFRNILL